MQSDGLPSWREIISRCANHSNPYRVLVQFGLQADMRETHARSIAKAISYRIVGSATTGLIFYVLTGKGSLSIGAGLLDGVVKIGAYFIHERVWNHIEFGRGKPPDYEI